MRKLPSETPFRPGLAVADRVERGDLELARVGRRRRLGDERRDGVGHLGQQRHLDEDQRLVGKLRVEEGEAAAVGLQPASQVVPAVDGVHRLVADDLFEQVRRRVPVDLLHAQEAGVEPRREQVQEVVLDRAQLGLGLHLREQLAAHGDDRRGAAGRAVDAPQQLLARRLGGAHEADQVRRRGLGGVVLRAAQRLLRVGAEVARQVPEERRLAGSVEGAVAVDELAGDGDAVGLAALGQQAPAVAQQVAQRAFVAGAAGGVADLVEHGGRPLRSGGRKYRASRAAAPRRLHPPPC